MDFIQLLSSPMIWLIVALIGSGVWIVRLKQALNLANEKLPGLAVMEADNLFLKEENERLRSEISDFQVMKGESNQRAEQLEQLRVLQKEQQVTYEALQARHSETQSELASLKSRLETERESNAEKLALLDSAKQTLTQEFKVLSNEILEQKQQQMGQQSKETISGLVQPIQTSLDQFKQRIEAVHKEDLEGRASLTEQLKHLKELNQTMSLEAQNLTKALKGDQKIQGNWGEFILRKLLESTGLREGIEFETEKSFHQEGGKRLRPDVIINLPDSKHVIIDSKVSLVSYESALNSETEREKTQHIKNHIQSISKHIQALSDKRYDHLELLNAPDFVLMFIPIEGAYLMAIEQNPAIFENAFDKKVAVVTPTTLFTTLKTIEQLWRYERQSEHTVKLIKRAAEVHDKFVGFVDTFEKIGKQLGTAQGSFDQARRQMLQGNGNLVRQAEMLKELAGKTKKEIPQHLLDEAEGERLLYNESDS